MDVIPDKLRVKARWDFRSVTCMKRVISPISQRHSRRRLEAGYLRGSTVCTIKTIGRRMETAKSQQRKRGPCKSRHCPNSPAAHDWLRAAKRAMCVSLGRPIVRREEDDI